MEAANLPNVAHVFWRELRISSQGNVMLLWEIIVKSHTFY